MTTSNHTTTLFDPGPRQPLRDPLVDRALMVSSELAAGVRFDPRVLADLIDDLVLARSDATGYAIRRTDGEEIVEGYYSWMGVDGPNDWSCPEEQMSANDVPVEFEIVALVPVARRTFPSRAHPAVGQEPEHNTDQPRT